MLSHLTIVNTKFESKVEGIDSRIFQCKVFDKNTAAYFTC